MNRWLIITLAWLVVGVLSYAAILRFFPPTPIIVRERPDGKTIKESISRRFTILDLPQAVVFLIPAVVVSPFLLCVLVCHELCKPKTFG